MLALVPVLINIIIIIFDLKKKSPFVAFSGGTLLVFSLPHLYASIVLTNYQDSTFFEVSVQATVFLCFYGALRFLLLSYTIRGNNDEIAINPEIISSEVNFAKVMMLLFILGIVASFDFNIKQLFFSSWSDFRNESSIFKLIASFCFYAGSSLLLLAYLSQRWKTFFLGLFFILAVASILKTRSYLIALVCPLIIYYLLYGKWSVKKSIGLILLMSIFLAIYSGARVLRHAGSLDQVSASTFSEVGIDKGEFELVETLYFFVEKGGVDLQVSNPTLIRVLLLPVPASLIKKPTELSHLLWDQKIGVLGVSGSLHATVVGDSILAFKHFGAFLYALIYGFLFSVIELIYRKNKGSKTLYFGLICTVSFYISRGAVYNGLINLLIAGSIIYIYAIVSNLKFYKGNHE